MPRLYIFTIHSGAARNPQTKNQYVKYTYTTTDKPVRHAKKRGEQVR